MRKPIPRSRACDPERARRRKAKDEFAAGMRKLCAPDGADIAMIIAAAGTLEIAAAGDVVLDGEHIGRLVPAHRGKGAPKRLDVQRAPIVKGRRVVSPSWLATVRMMPCAVCLGGKPFLEQLLLAQPQSEAHHYPPRSRGGSDFETMPLCRPHHRHVTEHRQPTINEELFVAMTQHAILAAIRTGHLAPTFLLAVAVEAV